MLLNYTSECSVVLRDWKMANYIGATIPRLFQEASERNFQANWVLGSTFNEVTVSSQYDRLRTSSHIVRRWMRIR